MLSIAFKFKKDVICNTINYGPSKLILLESIKTIQCGDTLLTYVHIQISLNRMEIFRYLQFPMPRPLA